MAVKTDAAKDIDVVVLECREGGADKVYTLWMTELPTGWLVSFQYGPRNGTQQSGTKTKTPVSLAEAQSIYQRVLREKLAKGYTVSGATDVPAYSQVDGAVDSGLRPMLLTPVTEEMAETYLTDAAWAAQEKMNGKRIMIRVTDTDVVGVNRRGLECPIPLAVKQALAGHPCVLDGELIGKRYFVFDLLERQMNGKMRDLRAEPLGTRFGHAEMVVGRVNHASVLTVPMVLGFVDKRRLLAELRSANREGVVFKRLDARYAAGRIANVKQATAVKLKFYKTGSFVVLRRNDKNSIEVGAYKGRKVVSVGNVTVPEKYLTQIHDGMVVEVRYLYATKGDQLYQPNVWPNDDGVVTRDDIDNRACLLSQLQYEGVARQED